MQRRSLIEGEDKMQERLKEIETDGLAGWRISKQWTKRLGRTPSTSLPAFLPLFFLRVSQIWHCRQYCMMGWENGGVWWRWAIHWGSCSCWAPLNLWGNQKPAFALGNTFFSTYTICITWEASKIPKITDRFLFNISVVFYQKLLDGTIIASFTILDKFICACCTFSYPHMGKILLQLAVIFIYTDIFYIQQYI